MIKQLAHVCIQTDNLARTQAFYCEVLGLVKKFDFVRNGSVFGFLVDIGNNTFLEVFIGTPSTAPGTIKHLCLQVDSIDTIREQLIRHDISFTEKTLGPDNSWQIWCQDPNGIDIEFHQYTENSLQIIGGNCIVDSR